MRVPSHFDFLLHPHFLGGSLMPMYGQKAFVEATTFAGFSFMVREGLAMAEREDEVDVDEEADRDDESPSTYVNFDIASYPSDFTLSGIHELWNNKDITIPQFQRNFVWTIKQSSLLIESFLLSLPIPQVFLYIDSEDRRVVIDGQQRILSIVFFFDGYFGYEQLGRRTVFRLTGLSEKSPFSGKRFEDLSQQDQRRLRGSVLRAVNVKQLSPANDSTSMFHIFERLNTGGTPLTPQEIRNCVFHGVAVDLLQRLNLDKNWRLILGRQKLDKHQRDVEILLRTFAMCDRASKYDKPMKEFLNQTMKDHSDGKSLGLNSFTANFPGVTETIVRLLGAKPFHIRGPLNLAALDSVVTALMSSAPKFPTDLKARYGRLLADDKFKNSIFFNTSDVSVVKSRLEMAREYLVK